MIYEDIELGPLMRALTEKQRRFVMAMACDPFGSASGWAKAAGYSDTGEACKVRGSQLIHDPRIEAAVAEFARGCLNTVGPLLGTHALLTIAADREHPKHLRAVEMLLNRVGLHEKTEHHVSVAHIDQTGAAMAERIKRLAEKYGIDAGRLLGGERVESMKLIEGTAEEVG